jgi:hypothetical protein
MFVKITNGVASKYPYTLRELRLENPGTSFPEVIPEGTLESYGVHRVEPTAAPKFDNKTHTLTDTVENVDGVWRQRWVENRLPEDRASTNVRRHRDQLLQDSDWVVVFHTEKGTNIPLEWQVYRQALRDITDHVNFPHLQGTDWPVKP